MSLRTTARSDTGAPIGISSQVLGWIILHFTRWRTLAVHRMAAILMGAPALSPPAAIRPTIGWMWRSRLLLLRLAGMQAEDGIRDGTVTGVQTRSEERRVGKGGKTGCGRGRYQ